MISAGFWTDCDQTLSFAQKDFTYNTLGSKFDSFLKLQVHKIIISNKFQRVLLFLVAQRKL